MRSRRNRHWRKFQESLFAMTMARLCAPPTRRWSSVWTRCPSRPFIFFPGVRHCRHFPLELGRGCPFSCTFCSTNDFFRRRFRLKSPAHMIAEMRRVKETYGIDSFELVHDMFTVDRKRVVEFCEALIASQEEFTWGCSARTDCVDEELIAFMARAGCRGIFFGIETGSRRMQRIIDKG